MQFTVTWLLRLLILQSGRCWNALKCNKVFFFPLPSVAVYIKHIPSHCFFLWLVDTEAAFPDSPSGPSPADSSTWAASWETTVIPEDRGSWLTSPLGVPSGMMTSPCFCGEREHVREDRRHSLCCSQNWGHAPVSLAHTQQPLWMEKTSKLENVKGQMNSKMSVDVKM